MCKIIGFLILLVVVSSAVQNLDEMMIRKDRMLTNDYPWEQLEDISNYYIWQPEALCYYDTVTGHEVWRFSNTPGLSNFYHNDIVYNPWSADGKRLAWSSVRQTQAFNNNDDHRIWMIMNSDGSCLRTPVNTPRRLAGGYPLFWSQQLPNTYYQMGDDHYMGSTGEPGTLYKVTVTDTAVSREELIQNYPYGTVGIYISVVSISSDGKKIMVRDPYEIYTSVALFPSTIYPEAQAGIDVPDGYPYWRDSTMSRYVDTPPFFDHAHAGMYRLLGPYGEWFFTMPSGCHVRWKYKTLGSAPDGGPLWTDDSIPPYDFGEIWPESGCNPNPFDAPYLSHAAPDRWGRCFLHTNCNDPAPYGMAIWDLINHVYVTEHIGTMWTQHHSWDGFTDYLVSTKGGDYPDTTYNHDRIAYGKYDDSNSLEEVCYTHTFYNNGGHYTTYSSLPRPCQSPDGTKVGWHSEFLNAVQGNSDIYWSVVYYPFPPTDLGAIYENGVKLNWLPPRYTDRGWSDESTDPAPYAREIKTYHIWRSDLPDTGWQEVGSVDATYHVDDYYGLVADLDVLHYTDNPGDGTYYYAVTSEEHSMLESRELSEILEIIVSGTSITTSVVQPPGQTDFWRIPPPAPSDFHYNATGTPGHYQLTWTEPSNSKIRYYNIYYSINHHPPVVIQQNRMASVPVGTSTYLDWLADPSNQGYYNITSVDRYGNESSGAEGIFEVSFPKVVTKCALAQNYPNPFKVQTLIHYSIPKLMHVQIKIYNILGQIVHTLVDEEKHEAGEYSLSWNGFDNSKEIASGVYFYQLCADNQVYTKKMLLLR